ncbi:fatty acyl-AMP ligase [Verrucosispora sp. WMMD573]|uniref:fatty acyl-AMP ligase n=1 Tax=Verrucosispora sp. WMMD573 TaxID=3015149 RepID=UPI00248CBF37|nr:fatty acyl-AMP ligase [Verrucosispora sp. WMMD573]WBB53439.1 fatty acyl-AMP ligase [Verrucosispora sp. WMMD573]
MIDLSLTASAATAIRGHARTTPERAALIVVDDIDRPDGHRRWSFAQLDAEARRIGAWLQARHPAGDRVLLLYPTGFDFAAALVGCLYAGMVAVPAPLPGRYPHERSRARGIAENAGPSAVLTDTANRSAVLTWAQAVGLSDLPLLATDSPAVPEAESWSPSELDHDTLAIIQYTSGTVGEPRGVPVSHGNLLHDVENQRRVYGLTTETRLGGWVPLHHAMGLFGHLLPALLVGGGCVLMHPAAFIRQPHRWLRMIDKYDIQVSAAPDFAFEMCRARVTDTQLSGLDLSRWRIGVNGAERVHAETLEAFAKRFAPAGLRDDVVCPCYGLSEATLLVSADPFRKAVVTRVDEHGLERHRFTPTDAGPGVVSCGTPRHVEVLIVDPTTGAALPAGAIGEIWVRGPSVSRGYWRDEAATDRTVTVDGYVRTGDLGTMHEGELYVTGRTAELLVVDGRCLYPQEIERALRAQIPGLGIIGAVFTVPRDESRSGNALVVVSEINGRPSEERLRHLADEITRTLSRDFGVRPDGIVLLRRGGVRRATSGKVKRAEMRRLFLGDGLDPVYTDWQPLATATS